MLVWPRKRLITKKRYFSKRLCSNIISLSTVRTHSKLSSVQKSWCNLEASQAREASKSLGKLDIKLNETWKY